MSTWNNFRLRGTTGSVPEITYRDSGEIYYAEFSLYVYSPRKDKTTDEWIKASDCFTIRTYNINKINEFKENKDKWRPGTNVELDGRIVKHMWESKDRTNKDGSRAKDSRIVLVAEHITWLSQSNKTMQSDIEEEVAQSVSEETTVN